MGESVDSAGICSAKRVRDESGESPEAKRLRAADLILDILEDVDSADRSLVTPSAGDLDTVLKSFEEEIAALSPNPSQIHPQEQAGVAAAQAAMLSTLPSDSEEPRQSDLDYLLEASDDDLGLPPTAQSSDEGEEGTEGDLEKGGLPGPGVLGQIWGFDDEIATYYDSLGFGGFEQDDGAAAGGGEVVDFDGGLFGYSEAAVSAAPDFVDYSWRSESLPAV